MGCFSDTFKHWLTLVVDRASGNFKGPVPWGEVIPRISDFIDAQYLPDGFAFTTPDHLKVKDCVALLKHLLDRERSLGVGPDVFAWKAFAQRQKNGGVVPTPALISFNQQEADGAPLPSRPRPKPKGKGKQKQTVPAPFDGNTDSGMDTPDDVDWRLAGPHSGRKSSVESDNDEGEPGNSLDWMTQGLPLIRMPAIDSDDAETNEEHLHERSKRAGIRKTKQVLSSDDDEDGSASDTYDGLLPSVPPQNPAPNPASVSPPAASLEKTSFPSPLPSAPLHSQPSNPAPEPTSNPPAAPPATSSERPSISPAAVARWPEAGSTEKRSLVQLPAEDAASPAVPAKRTRLEVDPNNVMLTQRKPKESQRVKDIQAAAAPQAPPKRKTATTSARKAPAPKSKPSKKKT